MDCIVKGSNKQLIIIIIYDEYIFLANDGIRRALTRVKDSFLQLKSGK